MQIEDEAFCRQCILEELLRVQTTPESHLREIHLGLVSIYERRLIELRREAASTRG